MLVSGRVPLSFFNTFKLHVFLLTRFPSFAIKPSSEDLIRSLFRWLGILGVLRIPKMTSYTDTYMCIYIYRRCIHIFIHLHNIWYASIEAATLWMCVYIYIYKPICICFFFLYLNIGCYVCIHMTSPTSSNHKPSAQQVGPSWRSCIWVKHMAMGCTTHKQGDKTLGYVVVSEIRTDLLWNRGKHQLL